MMQTKLFAFSKDKKIFEHNTMLIAKKSQSNLYFAVD